MWQHSGRKFYSTMKEAILQWNKIFYNEIVQLFYNEISVSYSCDSHRQFEGIKQKKNST